MQSSHLPVDCEQRDSEPFMHRGHAGLQRWGRLPVLACQTLCPASPAIPQAPSPAARVEAGGCRWFPSAYFLVLRQPTRTYINTYIVNPRRPSDRRHPSQDPSARCRHAGSASRLPPRQGNNAQADHPAQSRSVLARGRCSSWLPALRAANVKMPSCGFAFDPSYPNLGWSLCKTSHYFI